MRERRSDSYSHTASGVHARADRTDKLVRYEGEVYIGSVCFEGGEGP